MLEKRSNRRLRARPDRAVPSTAGDDTRIRTELRASDGIAVRQENDLSRSERRANLCKEVSGGWFPNQASRLSNGRRR